MDDKDHIAEIARKRYTYRRLIMRGRLALKHKSATRLIGPDCAYHLYSNFDGHGDKEKSFTVADDANESATHSSTVSKIIKTPSARKTAEE